MDNLYNLVLGGIKQGIIDGYKKYIQLFTDDFQFWRSLAAQKKATEYFLTVHTAERLYEECREHSVTICPEMQFKAISKKCYTVNATLDNIFEVNFQPPKSKDTRKVDIAILQAILDDPCPFKTKVIYVVEIKSIDQWQNEIINDIERLRDLLDMHEINTIKSAFAVYLKQKKDTKIDSNDFLNEERAKIEELIRERNILSNDLNLKVTSFPILRQDRELVQQDEETWAWDDSHAIELYGFIVEITKQSK